MKILSVESSGLVASVALSENTNTICEISLGDRLTHSKTLLPMVEQCLNLAEVDINEIDIFACDIGPGSFTGIRIGIATTNAFVMSNNKKAVGVNSLEVLAANISFCDYVAVPMIDARNGRIFCAKYDASSELPIEIEKPIATNIIDIMNSLDNTKKHIFIGSGALANEEMIRNHSSYNKNELLNSPDSDPRAAMIGFYANSLANAGIVFDELSPLYLRASQAEQVRDNVVG